MSDDIEFLGMRDITTPSYRRAMAVPEGVFAYALHVRAGKDRLTIIRLFPWDLVETKEEFTEIAKGMATRTAEKYLAEKAGAAEGLTR